MKLIIMVAVTLLSFSIAGAQENEDSITAGGRVLRYELGAELGEPTGANFKWWITKNNAIDALIGIAFVPDATLQIHADYLRHAFGQFRGIQDQLPIIYGLGVAGQFRDEFLIGLRIPVGVQYLFESLPFTVFLHVAPRLDFTPDFGISMNSSVGVRYVF